MAQEVAGSNPVGHPTYFFPLLIDPSLRKSIFVERTWIRRGRVCSLRLVNESDARLRPGGFLLESGSSDERSLGAEATLFVIE